MLRAETVARVLPVLMLALGVPIAFLYANSNAAPGESGQAAIALLRHGYIGDPYLLPSGPTAHVSPAQAGVLAAIFRLFGANTPAARIVLGLMTAGLYALSLRATLALCQAVGGGPAVWAGGALALATPVFLFHDVVYFRQWDQPFAAVLLVLGWLLFERSWGSPRPYRGELGLALLAGGGSMFSPTVLPPLGALLLWLGWHRRRLGEWRRTAGLSLALLALFLLPWGLRNQVELGSFILTRSNFPLELAAGNSPGADGISSSGEARALHPHDSPAAAREVQQRGEVAYMREMQDKALGWIRADPGRFAGLVLTRLRLIFLPDPALAPWMPMVAGMLPLLLLAVLDAARLAAFGLLLWQRRWRLLAAGVICVALPMAPYALTHVNTRYLFTTYFTTIALAALAMARPG